MTTRPKPLSHAQRSAINRRSRLAALAVRKDDHDRTIKRSKEMKGVPVKVIKIYSPDFITLSKLADGTRKTRMDILHRILSPIAERLESEARDVEV